MTDNLRESMGQLCIPSSFVDNFTFGDDTVMTCCFRPVFKPYSGELDTDPEFTVYRYEGSKVSEEEMVKHLQDLRRQVIQ